MLRVLYLILILVFSNGVIDAVSLKDMNVKGINGRLVLKIDINNDGHVDYIERTSNIRKPIILYFWNGKDYTKSEINSSALIDNVDEMYDNSIFVLQDKNEKIIVYTCSLMRFGQGTTYEAGHIVDIYKYLDGTLEVDKEYYTKRIFDEETEKCIISNNLKEGSFGHAVFISKLVNEEKTFVLLQSFEGVFLVDSSGGLIRLKNYIPDYMKIKDFKVKDSNVKAVVTSLNMQNMDTGFQIWSSADNTFSNVIYVNTSNLTKIKMSDDSFEVEAKKDNKSYRHKFIIHNNNKIEKIKTEKIGFWHKLIN